MAFKFSELDVDIARPHCDAVGDVVLLKRLGDETLHRVFNPPDNEAETLSDLYRDIIVESWTDEDDATIDVDTAQLIVNKRVNLSQEIVGLSIMYSIDMLPMTRGIARKMFNEDGTATAEADMQTLTNLAGYKDGKPLSDSEAKYFTDAHANDVYKAVVSHIVSTALPVLTGDESGNA